MYIVVENPGTASQSTNGHTGLQICFQCSILLCLFDLYPMQCLQHPSSIAIRSVLENTFVMNFLPMFRFHNRETVLVKAFLFSHVGIHSYSANRKERDLNRRPVVLVELEVEFVPFWYCTNGCNNGLTCALPGVLGAS